MRKIFVLNCNCCTSIALVSIILVILLGLGVGIPLSMKSGTILKIIGDVNSELPKIKPTITSVKALSANSLQVEWNTITSVSENELSYIVEVINANSIVEVKTETGSISQPTMKLVFKDLKPNTKYDLRIQAMTPSGLTSGFSDIVSATTLISLASRIVCPLCKDSTEFMPVCANDDLTYWNECNMKKTSCNTNENLHVIKAEQCGLAIDSSLVFAVDSSLSTSSDTLNIFKDLVIKLIESLDTFDYTPRVAVISIGEKPNQVVGFDDVVTLDEIKKKIQLITPFDGTRSLKNTFQFVNDDLFTPEHESNDKILVLFLSNEENAVDHYDYEVQLKNLKNKYIKIIVFALDVHMRSFHLIPSNENLITYIKNKNDVPDAYGKLEDHVRDPCQKIQCGPNRKCVVLADMSTNCMCQQCPDEDEYEPVCGDNGQTYATKCRMIQESCGIMKTIKFSKYGVCETVDNLDIYYAFDTSTTITDGDISKLQQLAIATLDYYIFGASRTSIISFGKAVETVLDISQGIDRNRVQSLLNSIPLVKGARDMNKMLTVVQSLIGQTSKNKQLLIIFTKDAIEYSELKDFEGNIKALRDKGVKVALISIGSEVDDNVQNLLDDVAVVKNSNELPRLYPDFEGFFAKALRETAPIDVVMVLGSHGNDADEMFIQQVDAAKALIKKYDVSFDKTHIGLIVYGKHTESKLLLKDGSNKELILYYQLSVLKNPDDGNNLIGAMKYVVASAFSIQNGARMGVPKRVILFLDQPITDNQIELNDELKRLKVNGIKVITVIIGGNVDFDADDTFVDVFFFPKDLYYVNRVIKTIVQTSQPDSCSGVQCTSDSTCEPRRIRKGACVCPNCENFNNYQQICADNGLSYANLCRMRKHACVIKKGIKALKLVPCGITGKLEVVFAFDTSDNVTTNLFNKMKNFTGELLTSFNYPKYFITLVSFAKKPFGKMYVNKNRTSVLKGLKDDLIVMKGQRDLKVLFSNVERAAFRSKDIPKIFVVFLPYNDSIDDFNDVSLSADKLRIKGIKTIFAGIGIGSSKQHKQLVSKEKYVLSVSHASDLPDLYGPLENAIKDAMALPAALDLAVAFSMTDNDAYDAYDVFNAEKQFVLNLLPQFTITPELTRFALMQYGRLSKIQYEFGELYNHEQTKESIEDLVIGVAGNNLLMMLKQCNEIVFTKAYGARDDIPKSLLIFNNQKTGSILADYKKELDMLRNLGVKIVVIGISSMVDKYELETISSTNDAYFYSEDLLGLNGLIDPVVQEMMPDPCIKTTCSYFSKCAKVNIQKSSCVCSLCPESDFYSPLCGTNGKTYANRCWMNRDSCLEQKEILIAKYESCGLKVKIDILYALDGSKAVSENDFKKMIAFVEAAARSFDIGASKTRIGLMVFGEATKTYLEFNSGISFDVVQKALLQARLIGGPRHVYNLLDDMNNNVFTDTYIAGGKHPYLIILTTGGDQSFIDLLSLFSTAQALQNKGVHIVTIVIGDENFLPSAGMISAHQHDVIFVESAIMLPRVLGDAEAYIGLNEASPEKLDLGFIIGATGTPSHYDNQINFIEEMLESITISSTETLVGTIMNGQTPYIPIKLGDAVTNDDYILELIGLTNEANGNNLISAFQMARASLLSVEVGARKNVPKSLLVFVDSKIVGDIKDLEQEAKALQDLGIKIILIGMGDDFDANVYVELVDVFFLAEELSHLDRMIYPVIQSVLPDICIDNECREYSICLTLPDRRTECVCATCTTDYIMFCGDNRKTYASLCRLEQSICLYNTPSKAASPGACDTSGVSDTLFLLDGSSSVTKNTFNEMQRFIHEVLTGLDLSVIATRASLAVHGSSILSGVEMTEKRDLLYQSLEGLHPVGGLRQMGLGLQYAHNVIFTGSDRQAAKVVVMFTTGPNDISGQEFMLTQANKLKAIGVEIVIIGIGNTFNKTEFINLVSYPLGIFEVADINDLPDLLHKVIILSIPVRERAGLCNPSLYYNFANTSKGIVHDESGSNNFGKLHDEVQIKKNYKCEKGAEFKNGHIEIDGKNFKGKPIEGITIATWLWLEDVNDPTHLLFVTVDPGLKNSGYGFGIATSGSIEFNHHRVFGRMTSPVIKQKEWTHIAATYNMHLDEVNIYVNGVEFTSFTRVDKRQLTEFSQNWEKTSIGKFELSGDGRYLRGRIDEYFIYPCALAEKQVNELKDKKCTEKPPACSSIKCSFYADCVVNSAGKGTCECPKSCANEPQQRICGSDGRNYLNECDMKKTSCEKRKLVTNAFNGKCQYNLFFDVKSYQAVKYPSGELEINTFEFSIRPESDNGVLFYAVDRSGKTQDYLALILVDGYVNMRVDTGNRAVAHVDSDERVLLNQWNTIIASRNGRDSVLVVNNGTSKTGKNQESFLQVDPIAYLGGSGPNPRPVDIQQVGTTTGFHGCIRQLSFNNIEVNLQFPGPDVVEQVNISPRCFTPCTDNLCQSGSACVETSAHSYQCRCSLGYRGTYCKEKVFFIPDSPLFFNGISSYVLYSQMLDGKHNHEIFISFQTAQPNGMLLYAQGASFVSDYLLIYLEDNKVKCSFDLGTGHVTLISDRKILLNRWVDLRLSRHDRHMEMFFFERSVASGSSPGAYEYINLHTVFYVGKVDKLFFSKSHPPNALIPFKGCIRTLKIDYQELKFQIPGKYIRESYQLTSCAECHENIDLVFVVDASTKVGADGYYKIKQFINGVASYFDFNTLRVAVIVFSGKAKVQIQFDPVANYDWFSQLVESLPFDATPGHALTEALELAYDQLQYIMSTFSYVVLLTSSPLPNTVSDIRKKLVSIDANVLAIGIGNEVTVRDIVRIASENFKLLMVGNSLFMSDSLDELIGLIVKIREYICKTSSNTNF